jgi:hypothetical protein
MVVMRAPCVPLARQCWLRHLTRARHPERLSPEAHALTPCRFTLFHRSRLGRRADPARALSPCLPPHCSRGAACKCMACSDASEVDKIMARTNDGAGRVPAP